MKVIYTLFALTCTVLCIQVPTHSAEDKDFIGLARSKRQAVDDRWSWGYVDVTDPPHKDKLIITSTSAPPDSNYPDARACEPYDPPLPNFLTPGRRISEAKCDEYVWLMKLREQRREREQECSKYLESIRDPNLPPPFSAIGGHATEAGDYPHMGAVGWKAASGTWVFKCGSSLISSKFLLTAGHCSRVSSRDDSVADHVPKIVRLGDKNIADVYYNNQLPHDKDILRIISHPQYTPPKKYNDLAIIELTTEVSEFTKLVQPACLWPKFDTSSLGSEATLTGWGVIETTHLKTSPELQAAEVDIIDAATCSNLLRTLCSRLWCGIQDGQICAGKLAGGVDSCQGDSGGPLQVKIPVNVTDQGSLHYVIGVTSFGSGCGIANKPGVYTRVSHYIDWIEQVVWS